MSENMKLREGAAKVLAAVKKNKLLLLLVLAGALLLLWPAGGSSEKSASASQSAESGFSLADEQAQIESMLESVDGAGRVKVMLTLESGMEQVLAENTDEKSSASSGDDITSEKETSSETVTVGSGDSEAPVVLRREYPVYQGALVVAEGADDASVKLALTKAVSSLTGLSTDKITVIKMKVS